MDIGTNPTVEGLNQLELAVLMEKYILLLGMINYGTKEQKKKARKEFREIDSYIHNHVNAAAFDLANRRLQFTEEELEFIEKVG